MQQALHRSSLVPRGFVVESAYYEGDKAIVLVRASGSVGLCPSCGTVSRRVHSRYRRRDRDGQYGRGVARQLTRTCLCQRSAATDFDAEWRT